MHSGQIILSSEKSLPIFVHADPCLHLNKRYLAYSQGNTYFIIADIYSGL